MYIKVWTVVVQIMHGGEIKIVTVEDSFKMLNEEGKELNTIIYLREKNIGI